MLRLQTFWLVTLLLGAAWRGASQDTSWPTDDAVHQLYSEGNYSAAEPLLRAALREAERSGSANPRLASAFQMLGNLCRDLGRYGEAETFLRRSVATWEKLPPVSGSGLLHAQFNLGTLYLDMGQYRKAEQLIQRALAKPLAPAAQAGFRILLGDAYRGQRHYANAEQEQREAFAIWEQQLQSEYPALGYSIFNSLGVLCNETGRHSEALRHFERSRQLMEGFVLPNHPDLPRLYSNLAAAYAKAGRTAEAQQWFTHALALAERLLGADHPTVAHILAARAEVLRKGGSKHEAREMDKRARAIMDKHERDNPSRHTVDVWDLSRH